jgi:hypothetical protein
MVPITHADEVAETLGAFFDTAGGGAGKRVFSV